MTKGNNDTGKTEGGGGIEQYAHVIVYRDVEMLYCVSGESCWVSVSVYQRKKEARRKGRGNRHPALASSAQVSCMVAFSFLFFSAIVRSNAKKAVRRLLST